MAVLKLRIGGREETFPITQDITILGRSTENAIYVDDRQCSRNHCQVERFSGGWKLVDLASRNGTRVNGATVNQHLLRSGDRIEIGDTAITFLDAPDETDPRIPGPPRAGVAGAAAAPGSPRAATTGMPTPPSAALAPGVAGAAPPAYPYPPPPYPPQVPPHAPTQPPAAGAYPPLRRDEPSYPGAAAPPAPAGYPPAGYPPAGYPPAGYPPAGYPPAGYPPAAGWPGAPAHPPGAAPQPHAHPSHPPSVEKKPARQLAAPSTGSNPGVIAGVLIVALALLAGLVIMIGSDGGKSGSGGGGWAKTLEKGEKLYSDGKFDDAAAELKKIPSSAKEYKNAQTILGDIIQRKRYAEEEAQRERARVAWDPIREKWKKFENDMMPEAEQTALRDEIRAFIGSYPAAFEIARAKEYYVKLGGKPEDVGGGSGTAEPDLAKEAEAAWGRLGQRVEMYEKGDLPQDEVDRLKAELRNFIAKYYRYPEAAQAQQVIRKLGVTDVGPGPGPGPGPENPPTGDPKTFAELTRLVEGLMGGANWGEAVKLLEDWINKDPTGADAAPATDKIREVRKGADNWYLGREAEADSLAQGGKFAEAKAILEDAVKRLGEKAFFENTAAAKKKIQGLEKAMGGGK